MHANGSAVIKNGVIHDDVAVDLYPFIVAYKDGRVERFLDNSFVPASEDPAAPPSRGGVVTRDVVIDQGTGVSARLFLPSHAVAATTVSRSRLPLVMYIHGGSFCTGSAFSRTYHRYAASLAASSGALVVSVEYRLAPEYPVPTAYDDAWAAFRWVASLSDPWLAEHVDPRRVFLAGDSAGGNIAYHTAVRAGAAGHDETSGGMEIEGLMLVHPFFWGAERLPSETAWVDGVAEFPPLKVDMLWPFVTAGKAGNDDPRLNPTPEEIASLTCRRVLMAVAEKDTLRERGCRLAARMRDLAWFGDDDVVLVESEGEDHVFHLSSPLRATSKSLMATIARFIDQISEPSPAATMELSTTAATARHVLAVAGVPTRPFMNVLGDGAIKVLDGPTNTACGAVRIGKGTVPKTSYGLFLGRRRNKARGSTLSTVMSGWSLVKDFL